MDSAKNVLRSIELATRQVQNATAQYSIIRSTRTVRQHSLIQLEFQFQKIANASRAIQKVLEDPLLYHDYLDGRLMDWLSSTEPETCLDALREMDRLLGVGPEAQGFSGFPPTRSACEEDSIHAAIVLFHAHDAHFHYLLTTDIWIYGNEVRRQTIPSRTEEFRMQRHGESRSALAMGSEIENQRKEVISQKLKKLLKLLDPLDCSENHRKTSSLRQSDTCMWLPATGAYRSWREGKDSFLWLQGKAGAGKSVLASLVISDLKNTINDGEFLVYFYCDFRTRRSTSAVEVMRSILAQLMARLPVATLDSEDLLDDLLKDSDSHAERFYSIKGLSHYLSKVARLCLRTPVVVVDALDECRDVESLLDRLIRSAGDLRIFATSRPLQNIISMLSPFPCISMGRMADELSADIQLHVTRELDSRPRLRTFNKKLKEVIRLKLCAKADGMFRWVQCQIDTLEKCSLVSEIWRVLESLPEGLEETYRRILNAIDRQSSDAPLVRLALVWLVTALRPMCMRELLEGLTVDPIRRTLSRSSLIRGADLLDFCRSLVVHHEETDIITLSHMSVKEYLVGEFVHAKLPWYHIVLEDAHERVARLCMAYIAFCLEQMKGSRDRSSILTQERDLVLTTSYASLPLLKYVLSDGFNHLAHLGPSNSGIFKDIEALQAITRGYTRDWDRMCKLVPSIRTGVPWPTSEHDFTFYILVAFASDALFETFVRCTGLIPQEGTNPLVYAAHFGKTALARVLISQGANVNHPGLIVNHLETDDSDVDNMATSLEVAVDRWNAEMIDLLLAKGSIVPDTLLGHVLEEHPHDYPLSVIGRLLQTGEFLVWADTPWENQRLLEVLLDHAEDYEQADGGDELMFGIKRLVQVGCAEMLLLIAVERGCVPIIRTLLSTNTTCGLDISSASHTHAIVKAVAADGDTSLHLAMKLPDEIQCLIITKLLVEAGCSPCELDADDKPPLHIAVVRGFLSVVEYLLSQDVSLPSRILFAALRITSLKRVEMIRLLISKGAPVDVLNPDRDTLLHVAMRSLDRSVCPEIVRLFIDAGCDPSILNLYGETPLRIAAREEYHEIGNYLLLLGTSSDIWSLLDPDPSSQATALRSLIGNVDGSRFLPEEEDRLLQAIRKFLDDEDKYIAVAKTLLAASDDHARVFDSVVRRGFCRVVEYLLSQCIPLPRGILFTALRHQVSMIPFLVCKGAHLHAIEDIGDTLLHVAIRTLEEARCLMTVHALVRAGCHSSISNYAGQVPIDIAVSRGFVSVVEYLLSKDTPPPQGISFTVPRHQILMVPFPIRNRGNLDAKEEYEASRNDAMTLDGAQRDTVMRALREVRHHFSASYYTVQVAIDIAVSRGLFSVVQYLLSEHATLSQRPSSTELDSFLIHKGDSLDTENEEYGASQKDARTLVRAQRDTVMKALFYARRDSPASTHAASNQDVQVAIDIAESRGLSSVAEYLLFNHTLLPQGILFTALQHHQVSMVPFLLRKGADVHVRNDGGDTFIHAAMSISEEPQCHMAVQILVQAGCPTSSTNAAGLQPIHIAVFQGFISVVKYLLSRAPPDRLPPNLLSSVSSRNNSSSMIRLLLDHGGNVAHVDLAGNGLLHHVMQFSGEEECLKATRALIRAGCRHFAPNAWQETPLHAAVERGFVSVADYLISNDVPLPPDILFSTLRSQPIYEQDTDELKSLVTLFINKGADVHARDANGDTLMHHAMRLDSEIYSLEATKYLVEADCSTSVSNADGVLPVQIAVTRAFISVVEYLLAHNAPFPRDILPTAMQVQSFSRVPRMVSLLVQNGADVSVCATNGDSVLHVALAREPYSFFEDTLLEVVKILVQEGCDTSACGSSGRTPLEVAVAMRYSEVENYLRTFVSKEQLSFNTPLHSSSTPSGPSAPRNPLSAPPSIIPSTHSSLPSPPSPPLSESPPPSTPSHTHLPLDGVQQTISKFLSRYRTRS